MNDNLALYSNLLKTTSFALVSTKPDFSHLHTNVETPPACNPGPDAFYLQENTTYDPYIDKTFQIFITQISNIF